MEQEVRLQNEETCDTCGVATKGRDWWQCSALHHPADESKNVFIVCMDVCTSCVAAKKFLELKNKKQDGPL